MGVQSQATDVAPQPAVSAPAGYYRWVICALLFFATTINYLDRGILGVLAPDLQHEIGWTATEYGDINAAFSFAYALGFIFLGRFIDRVGSRVGYAVSLVIWSLAAAGHALARSAFDFGIARFLLGFGESGNFPAAVKTTAPMKAGAQGGPTTSRGRPSLRRARLRPRTRSRPGCRRGNGWAATR